MLGIRVRSGGTQGLVTICVAKMGVRISPPDRRGVWIRVLLRTSLQNDGDCMSVYQAAPSNLK